MESGAWLALAELKSNTLSPCGETSLKLVLSPTTGFSGASGEHTRARTGSGARIPIDRTRQKGKEGMGKPSGTGFPVRRRQGRKGGDQLRRKTMLLPVASVGSQGDLPGFPLNSDSIMTWVAVHGRSAFLADPVRDVRMSAMFPDSGGEIAAPVTRGEIVAGVVLLATSSQEGFRGEALALLETSRGDFFRPGARPASRFPGVHPERHPGELPESAVSEIDHR
jgi:hypothetical protein